METSSNSINISSPGIEVEIADKEDIYKMDDNKLYNSADIGLLFLIK